MTERVSSSPGPASGLSRLLATEERLEALLGEARVRAAEFVREAEARAAAIADTVERELAAAAAAAGQQRSEASAERIRALSVESDRALARFRVLDETRIAALADGVCEQVLEGITAPGAAQ